MAISTSLSVALTTLFLALPASAQNPASSPNLASSFVGKWSGVDKITQNRLPHQVQLTITESQGGKEMTWNYVFGAPGEDGYARPSKSVSLDSHNEVMVIQWVGDTAITYSTDGLGKVARTGYGEFTASRTFQKKSFFSIKRITESATFEIEPSKLTYIWTSTTGGKSRVYSQFSFHRVLDANTFSNSSSTAQ